MKIIGTSTNGYILDATPSEMALLKGFRNQSSEGYSKPAVGNEFELGKVADVSRFVRTLDKDKLQYIKGQLERAVKELDEAVETAQSLTLFARLEEE